ncbi:MAG: Mur ligase family protein [Candidatus Hodarchaeales archaeon]
MRISSKNVIYYQSIWGKGPYIRFILSFNNHNNLFTGNLHDLITKYPVELKCKRDNYFHLLSHLIIGISYYFQKEFNAECIQDDSIEDNEIRIPILYRDTSITIMEELLDWLSNINHNSIIQWKKNHLFFIEKEFIKDKESKFGYLFRNWLIQNDIPVYEYEYSRNCWIIGEGKNKFVIYRTPDVEEKLFWSMSFTQNPDEWKEISVSKNKITNNQFQISLNEIIREKKTFDLRIPLFLITGTNGKTTTARMIAHILQETKNKVGITTSSGLYVDNKTIEKGDLTGPWSARNLVALDEISFGVLETARGGILKEGIVVANGFEGASVITNIAEDHLGMKGITTLEEMTEVKFLVAESILDSDDKKGRVIINADDDYLMEKMKNYNVDSFWGFSLNKNNLEKFSKGVYVKDNFLHFFNKNVRLDGEIISILDIPAAFGGNATFNVINAMSAAATCLSFGIPTKIVKSGLNSFKPDFDNSLGRTNLISHRNFKIFVDYAHNPHGMDAITPLLLSIKANNKILITMIAGDRDNEFIHEMSKKYLLLEPNKIIIKELQNSREREKGEVAKVLKNELINSGFSEKSIFIHLDESEAFKFGISICTEDDLLIAFTEKIENIQDLLVND